MFDDTACSCDLLAPLEELVMEIREYATEEDDEPICIAGAVWELFREVIQKNHRMAGELRSLRCLLYHPSADSDSPPLKRSRESF